MDMEPIVLFGGKFPLSGGIPQIYTREQFEECCCQPPAPCECPCETWPPESWPCGGLLEEYSFTLPPRGFMEYDGTTCSGDLLGGLGYRILPCTLTADGTPCTWEGLAISQITIDDPQGSPTWDDDYEVQITVRLVDTPDCQWVYEVVRADNQAHVLWSGHKPTGLTPAGQYIDDADPDGLRPTCSIMNPDDPQEDQDSIYTYGTGATVS